MANPSNQNQSARVRLGKHYKLPKSFKGPWFLSMEPADRRAFMLAQQAGETRAKNASKRDIETYAENAQNRNVGRASVAV